MLAGTLVAAICLQGSTGFVHEPTASYETRIVHGFTIRLSKAARANPATTRPALALIEESLAEIARFVPPRALAVIRKAAIWVEHNNPGYPSMCYHTSRDWLRENGYNTDKENSVEVANPKNYVAWTNLNQPYQLFHELAHAYHDLKFGFDDPYIAACHKLALASGKYDLVEHIRGGGRPNDQRRHYALNNPMEYFAEMSEAYFGKNDFYPFDRAQLKEYDPKGYAMIEWAWGR